MWFQARGKCRLLRLPGEPIMMISPINIDEQYKGLEKIEAGILMQIDESMNIP